MDLFDIVVAKKLSGGGGGGGGNDPQFIGMLDGSITSLVVPNDVVQLRKYAIERLNNLVSVDVNASGDTWNSYTIINCGALKKVVVAGNIATIQEYAVSTCPALEEIDLGPKVTSIGRYLYGTSFPANFKSLTVRAVTPPTADSNMLYGSVGKDFKIYVPTESVNAYKSASVWSTYSNKIEAIPS